MAHHRTAYGGYSGYSDPVPSAPPAPTGVYGTSQHRPAGGYSAGGGALARPGESDYEFAMRLQREAQSGGGYSTSSQAPHKAPQEPAYVVPGAHHQHHQSRPNHHHSNSSPNYPPPPQPQSSGNLQHIACAHCGTLNGVAYGLHEFTCYRCHQIGRVYGGPGGQVGGGPVQQQYIVPAPKKKKKGIKAGTAAALGIAAGFLGAVLLS